MQTKHFLIPLALAFTLQPWTAHPVAADGGPFSIGGRAVEFVPRDGNGRWGGGVQARYQLPVLFAVEGSVDYRNEQLGSTTIHDWPVQVSALMYVLPRILVVQPYILGGVGWYHTTVEGPNGFENKQSRSGPHVGAGVEVNLNAEWFIDATYRHLWLNDIRTQDANGNPQTLQDSSHMLTLGLNYRF